MHSFGQSLVLLARTLNFWKMNIAALTLIDLRSDWTFTIFNNNYLFIKMDLKPVTGNEPSSFISSNAEASEDQGPEVEVAVVDIADSEIKLS